jgi:hypothetical protein
MLDLSTFYHSREWHNFTDMIKMERVNEDGQLICEGCGKPITKKFDAICHHCNVFLTEDNVGDVTVSLNPDNIQVLHHRCHNLIHGKTYSGRREIYLIYGAPLSGKSTYLNEVKQPGDVIVDVDAIRKCVSGEALHKIYPTHNSIVFGIRNFMLDAIKTRKGNWHRAYVVGGYPLESARKRLCLELGAQEIFIEATKEECFERLEADADNRDVEAWRGYIDDWFEQYSPPSTT